MDGRTEIDCEGTGKVLGGVEDVAAQELADRREEWQRFYERVPLKATEGQIKYILVLLKEGWLTKDDFLTSKEFYRKRTHLTHARADELIRLGKKRMADDRRQRIEDRNVPKWMTE